MRRPSACEHVGMSCLLKYSDTERNASYSRNRRRTQGKESEHRLRKCLADFTAKRKHSQVGGICHRAERKERTISGP
jgi:hypothetical protein